MFCLLAKHVLLKSTGDAEHLKWNNTTNPERVQTRFITEKRLTKRQGRTPVSYNSCFFSHAMCSFFFNCSHFWFYSSILQSFFCLFAFLRKQAEKVTEEMNYWIKNVYSRKKNENTMWVKTQLLQETVPLWVLFCVFFSAATFLLWFGGLYKFSVLFSLSVQVNCVSTWFWQTMFLLACKNMVCQNQVETQGTWTDSKKGTANLYKPPNHRKKVVVLWCCYPLFSCGLGFYGHT